MKTGDIYITDHAREMLIMRFPLSKKISKNSRQVDNIILGIIGCGKEITPKDGFIKLINHGIKDIKYYERESKVAVVENKRVITVYPFNKYNFI